MSFAQWERALTDMEDQLDAQEALVRTGTARLVPAWEPPEGLGPLPPALADRAAHLVQRIGLLSTFVQFQLTSTENDLRHLHLQAEKGTHNRAMALFLDASI